MSSMIDKIISLEFSMFQDVQNVGGRACCQDNYYTFRIMRASQFETWTDEMLTSYLQDLTSAKESGENLVFEKYAYMMHDRCPDEYAKLESSLPAITEEKLSLVNLIVAVHVSWMDELAVTYPSLITNARPIHTESDTMMSVSSETYLRCELLTYSMQTLDLYAKYALQCLKEGTNLNKLILLNTVEKYQYSSLEDAEAYLAQKAPGFNTVILPYHPN